jgi:hypothetical protein
MCYALPRLAGSQADRSEQEPNRTLSFGLLCQYLVVTRKKNATLPSAMHTSRKQGTVGAKLVQWTNLTWQPEKAVPLVSEI